MKKNEEWRYKTTAKTKYKILGDKVTYHMIPSLPVEEPKQIMEVWQKLTGKNTEQTGEIMEKHKIIINRLK